MLEVIVLVQRKMREGNIRSSTFSVIAMAFNHGMGNPFNNQNVSKYV